MSIINEKLKQLYKEYKKERCSSLIDNIDIHSVSPPLLVKAFQDYEKASPRIALIGQCTFGWSWPAYKDFYPEWTYEPINTFHDFFDKPESVTWLMKGYELFKFAERQKRNYNSPIWRFYRTILNKMNLQKIESGIWTNLFRFDIKGYPPPKAILPHVFKFQQNLLRKELEILNPDIVIFVTYWKNDYIINNEFGAARNYPISGVAEKVLCRVEFPKQSFIAFRTYHPAYLQRIKLFHAVIDLILEHTNK